jgi:hypothetical protein
MHFQQAQHLEAKNWWKWQWLDGRHRCNRNKRYGTIDQDNSLAIKVWGFGRSKGEILPQPHIEIVFVRQAWELFRMILEKVQINWMEWENSDHDWDWYNLNPKENIFLSNHVHSMSHLVFEDDDTQVKEANEEAQWQMLRGHQ